jgi:hypothetical protein
MAVARCGDAALGGVEGWIMGEGPAAVADRVRVPADLRFLAVLRLAAVVMAAEFGGLGARLRDVELAVDELAAVLIRAAERGGQLELAVMHDDDLYVEMVVPVPRGPVELATPELTSLLLEATAESFDISVEGRALLGVLQFAPPGDTGP